MKDKKLKKLAVALNLLTLLSVNSADVFLFKVGNKIFCFFKKWAFPFLDVGTVQGG